MAKQRMLQMSATRHSGFLEVGRDIFSRGRTKQVIKGLLRVTE